MKRYLLVLLTACLCDIGTVTAQEPLYVCGAFNGWDPKQPAEFTYADGVYSLTIDFAKGCDFKISTVRGSSGNGWTEFDTGTLYPLQQLTVNRWYPLQKRPQSPDITAPEAKTMTVRVDLATMQIKCDNGGAEVHPWSGTLPVLFINTDGGVPVTDKEKYLTARYYLDPMGVEDVEALGSAAAPLTTQIKGRGNWTWNGFDKKPYRLKFADKQAPLGMPESKHFVLLAHADDDLGFQRNEMGFTASRLLQLPWTPQSKPLEVVLNGDYIGLYFLTQNIRVASDRVDITEQPDGATTDVDGGWLVEIDNYDTDPHVTVYEDGDASAPIWFTYKSPEVLSVEQDSYLLGQMQAMDHAVYSTDRTLLPALVDFDILARYYMVQEVMDDCESFHGSCYLNRNRGEEQKWLFGPVWDFGNSFRRDDLRQFIFQNPPYRQVWIGSIYEFPAFQAKVKELWSRWLGYGPEQMEAHAKAFAAQIQAAAACDLERWPQYGCADPMAKAESMISLLRAKTDWLKTQWGSEVSAPRICSDSSGISDTAAVYTPQGIPLLKAATPAQIRALPAGLYLLKTAAGTMKLAR